MGPLEDNGTLSKGWRFEVGFGVRARRFKWRSGRLGSGFRVFWFGDRGRGGLWGIQGIQVCCMGSWLNAFALLNDSRFGMMGPGLHGWLLLET